jgi:uncharacterized membrane protein
MPALITVFVRRVVSCFLAGLLALLPLVITVAVVIWVAGFLGGLLGPQTVVGQQLSKLGMRFSAHSALAYLTGWLLVLGIVFLVGVLVEMGAKKFLGQLVDAVLHRIPLIGNIYGTSKQLVDMLGKKDEADLQGMSVVFCMFGRDTGVGLLALLVSPERFTINGRDHQVVIVPTAPVPFGGGLLFVPVDSVIPADMSVDGLMSIYVSMGVTAPQFMKVAGTTEDEHPPATGRGRIDLERTS